MPSRITVRNLQRRVRVNLSVLRDSSEELLQVVLKIRGKRRTPLDQLEEISVLIVSDRRMAALHRKFLEQAGPTDVITFRHGEIFISAETTRRNARRFGNSFLREMQLCVTHGLLHLHGFDDGDASAAEKMKRTQERILAALN